MQDKYSILERESKIQLFWDEKNINTFDPSSELPIYSIDTPPPTVSGEIHIGHIFSYTQADIVARFKKMVGNVLFYPFGFDDNGLPTERLVEKEIGKKGSELSREDFNKECLNITEKYREKFKKIWTIMGFSVDWNLSYSTISPEVQKVSQTSFLNLIKKGIIYQKKSPCLWCSECQTAIAQAEVEKKELPSVFYDIEFNLTENGKSIVISTTRPELIPACVAVIVNPDDTRYANLIGKNINTPFGKTVKIIGDNKVDISKGSGVVMCCSYGDETDMYWIKKYSLEEKIILNESGKIINTGDLELDGIHYKKARKVIVDRLMQNNKIINAKNINHDVGTHERCGTPIEILTVKQYFIKTLDIKNELIEAGNKIKWNPSHMKKRYLEWVENLKWDWCISRQRYFGIPIPVWYSKKTGEIILPETDQLPINPLTNYPKNLPKGHTLEDIYPELDVLDTWATSSLTPQINSKFFSDENLNDKILPMSLRPQAHDIIRTWALYTIIMSYYLSGEIPFENIMISGHVLAPKGEKISKSKNNAGKPPEELIKIYGADPIRYWTCGSGLGKDIIFEEQEIKKGQKLVTKLWNVGRFAILNLGDFNPNEKIEYSQLQNIDKWIIGKILEVTKKMKVAFESFNVGIAIIEFEKFFWNDFCDNYIEIVKGKILNTNENKSGISLKKSSQYALYESLLGIVKLIAPILPHISEEIYQVYLKQFNKEESIHSTQYPKGVNGPDFLNLDSEINKLFGLIDLIRKYKTDNFIKYGVKSEEIKIYCTKSDIDFLKNYENEIISISRSNKVTFIDSNEIKVNIIL